MKKKHSDESLGDIFSEIGKAKMRMAQAIDKEQKSYSQQKEKKKGFLRKSNEFEEHEDLDQIEQSIEDEIAAIKAKNVAIKISPDTATKIAFLNLDEDGVADYETNISSIPKGKSLQVTSPPEMAPKNDLNEILDLSRGEFKKVSSPTPISCEEDVLIDIDSSGEKVRNVLTKAAPNVVPDKAKTNCEEILLMIDELEQ